MSALALYTITMQDIILGFVAGVAFTIVIQAWVAAYAERIRKEQRAAQDRKNELARLRYVSNPQVPLRSQARSVVRGVLNKEKVFRQDYGYSISQLIAELERQFDESMTFQNYGVVWEIDHVVPLKNFDLSETSQFCLAINPANLQPLFRGENQSKGAK